MARNHEVKVLFSKEEKQIIEKKAVTMGLKPSQFLRTLGLLATPEILKI